MPTFNFSFTVCAPKEAVTALHSDSQALRKLTPPPLLVTIHRIEPLSEGSELEFTIWIGPFPLRWHAIHRNVNKDGFTDIQLSGPMRKWEHTHLFTAHNNSKTVVSEHIEYEHYNGFTGVVTRILFFKPGLYLLFTMRKLLTRWHVEQKRTELPD